MLRINDVNSPRIRSCATIALGMFDGLHRGHGAVIGRAVAISRAKNRASYALTFEPSRALPPAKRNERILTPRLWDKRLACMGANGAISLDFAKYRCLSPREFVENVLHRSIAASAVVCGADFRFGHGAAGDAADLQRLCASLGMDAAVVPNVRVDGESISTTRIRALIGAGDIPAANAMLGYRFAIDFTVVHGRQLGRTINFPTINQPIENGFVTPRFGVYATVVCVGDRRMPGVTNVGVKPTVGSDCVLAETFILGFEGDLYGQNPTVEFLRFMRDERKFASVEELRRQILIDSAEARAIVETLELCK